MFHVPSIQPYAASSLKSACLFATLLALAGMVTLFLSLPRAEAQEDERVGGRGELSGRFVFEGTPPPRSEFEITRDQKAFERITILDESLLIGKNGGVANVVVWLRDRNVPAPSRDPSATAMFRIKAGRYDPHVLGMTTSQKLVVVNEESVGHSPVIQTFSNLPSGGIMPIGDRYEYSFTQPERLPVSVRESIHPWYQGWLLVRDNPYFAISDKGGHFKIRDLPLGNWEFQFWHEKSGYLKRESGWERGRLKISIGQGVNDLGTIALTDRDLDLSSAP